MDQEKIREGVKLILEGIGEDTEREGLLETPDRIARMYEEIAGGMYEDAGVHLSKRFHVDNNEMVVEKISPSTPSASIICFRSTEKSMWLMFPTEPLWA